MIIMFLASHAHAHNHRHKNVHINYHKGGYDHYADDSEFLI